MVEDCQKLFIGWHDI